MELFDARFTNEMNPSNAARVIDVMAGERFGIDTAKDYGAEQHQAWLGKTEVRLINNEAHALLAKVGLVAVGAIVFRLDPDDPKKVGIRNLSVDPTYWGRSFGTFLLDNAEHLAGEYYPEATTLDIDTKSTNLDMLGFLIERGGYTPRGIKDLYGSGPDIMLHKPLR